MSTIAENLSTLKSIKSDIQSAIIEKGGSASDSFASYAQAIRDLPSGGGGIDLYSITDKTLSEINDTKGTITDFDLYGFENLTRINLPQYWSIGYDTLIDPSKLTSLSLGDKLLIYDDFIFNVSGFDISKYSQTACILSDFGYSSLFDSGCLIYNLNSSNMSSYNWRGVPSRNFLFKTFTKAELPYAWYIGSSAFQYCYYINTLSIPEAIYIGSNAFYNCSSLTTVDLPQARYIGNGAFIDCSNLRTISIPEARYIGGSAFSTCPTLTTVDFPQAIYIGSNAFYSCSALTTVDLPQARYIGSDAFYSCPTLTTVDFPQAIYIGSNAFYGCKKITSVNLPKLTFLAESTFTCSSSLSFLSIPNVFCVPCFSDYSYLETVNIDNIKTLYRTAFSRCPKLKSLYMRSITSVPTWKYNCMPTNPSTALQIYVPSSLVSEFQTAQSWSSYSSYYVGV